ncbi:inositol-3-phosphate synthase [Candidatus Bathyarchaeota archaeon]|nr:inositol-3-phosphate synthase [Candidatus Bathyarchaeota archaeon]
MIRIALAGVGNCCSALIQGLHHYRMTGNPLGLLHETLGGYRASDIEVVAAFDIDRRKVGRDLSEAVFASPNTVPRMVDLPHLGVTVLRGPVLDGLGPLTKNLIEVEELEGFSNIAEELKGSEAEILINLISGGAEQASRYYAGAALEAGCAFINATPAEIACDTSLARRFEEAGLPLIGDDLLDQVGATAVHMGILEFLNGRGVHIDESYQLDVGGGMESLDTLGRTKEFKRRVKTEAVSSSIPYEFPLVSGSTDYVDFLEDKRESFLWVKGRYFIGAEFTMDIKMTTRDAPNAGAVLLDVIRATKLAMDRGMGGVVTPIAAYGFKRSPKRYPITEAQRLFERFVEELGG